MKIFEELEDPTFVPITTWDTVFVIICCVAFAFSFLCCIILHIFQRKYAIIRSKSPLMNTVQVISGLIWFLSTCIANGVLNNRTGFWATTCRFWYLWGQAVFSSMIPSYLIARLIQLYVIFVKARKLKIPIFLIVILLEIPIIIACISNIPNLEIIFY
jgi:hypothetical protein